MRDLACGSSGRPTASSAKARDRRGENSSRLPKRAGRWSLGEVTAEPDEGVATHVHPGEPEAFIIVEGEVELHGAQGVAHLAPGDIVFITPDTEHGLRTPNGGRWLAVWPIGERVPGKRYAG